MIGLIGMVPIMGVMKNWVIDGGDHALAELFAGRYVLKGHVIAHNNEASLKDIFICADGG